MVVSKCDAICVRPSRDGVINSAGPRGSELFACPIEHIEINASVSGNNARDIVRREADTISGILPEPIFAEAARHHSMRHVLAEPKPMREHIGSIAWRKRVDRFLEPIAGIDCSLTSEPCLDLMQEINSLMNAHVRKPVVLEIENHQRLVVGLRRAHEIADLQLHVIARVKMVTSP